MGMSGSNLMQVNLGLLLLLILVVCGGAMDDVDDTGPLNWAAKQRQCSGSIGECFKQEEEMVSGWESNQRSLITQSSHIGYRALKRGMVVCPFKGIPYYNCWNASQANPYVRACTKITRCARDTS